MFQGVDCCVRGGMSATAEKTVMQVNIPSWELFMQVKSSSMSEKDIPGRGSPQLPSGNFKPVWPGNAWCSKQAPSLLQRYWEPPNKILMRDS